MIPLFIHRIPMPKTKWYRIGYSKAAHMHSAHDENFQVEICCSFDLCVSFSLSVTWCAAARFFRLNIHQFKVHNSRTKERKSYFQDLFRVYLLLPVVLHI